MGVRPPQAGDSFPFRAARCTPWHLDLFKPIFAQRVLFDQVTKAASIAWMSAPSFPPFTTLPALSSPQTASAEFVFLTAPWRDTLGPFGKIARLAFPLKSSAVEYELKINRITADKKSWKILPLEGE